MAEDARFAYLQARLQARHGDRPAPEEWRLVEAGVDFAHYLEALRHTALQRWLGDIHAETAPEELERHLRAAWRAHVDELAEQSPEEWRLAIAWLRWLPDLPAVDHLLRDGKVPAWMRTDPVMREMAFDEPARRREAIAESPLAPVLPTGPAHAPSVVDAWAGEWRRRLPQTSHALHDELVALGERIRAHLEAMRSSGEPHGHALRTRLGGQLDRFFRRSAGTAPALFAHLALDGLELERVRAGLVARRLMPERAEGRAWA